MRFSHLCALAAAAHATCVAGARLPWFGGYFRPASDTPGPEAKLRTRAARHCAEFEESGKTLLCRRCSPGAVLLPGPPDAEGKEYGESGYKVPYHCAKLRRGRGKKLVLIRHGESVWNEVVHSSGPMAQLVGMRRRYLDSPLSIGGLRQAQFAARLLTKAGGAPPAPGAAASGPRKPDSRDPPWRGRARKAIGELEYTDLESLVSVAENGSAVSPGHLVENLRRHGEELEVLLGRRCNETRFVSSQLVRAMDTLNIVLLPARLRCGRPFEISSDLQEFEHNADCAARTLPRTRPSLTDSYQDGSVLWAQTQQSMNYVANQMGETLSYVGAMYNRSNVKRFTRNLEFSKRHRFSRHLARNMKRELKSIFRPRSRATKYVVWGGHSIWFRSFFKTFGDQADSVCTELGSAKLANVAIASVTIREVDDRGTPYAAVGCRLVHLGSAERYTYEVNGYTPTSVVPAPADFGRAPKAIAGWKCCCPKASGAAGRPSCVLARGWNKAWSWEKFGGGRGVKCGDPKTWAQIRPRMSAREASAQSWESAFGWAYRDKEQRACHVSGG